MSEFAIRTCDLGKRYWKTPTGRPAPPLERLRQAGQATACWAFRHVAFEVGVGDVFGVIGANGAGKSTLLRVLARVTPPNEGWAEMRGTVGTLLAVGAGFHPEMTGRENVLLNAALLGMSRRDVRGGFDAIVSMAAVEDSIDVPVKRYSSGMKVRLGFAVAAQLRNDIILIDEVLALGDESFRRQAVGTLLRSAAEGRTVVLVSHELELIEETCRRAAWLDDGKLQAIGAASEVVGAYRASVRAPA